MSIRTMDANKFISKLKAGNTDKDVVDLVKVFDEYKAILGQLPAKDRAPFSLNLLCVLCRNLDKAPKWRDAIDTKALLALGIDCVRETRAMEKADRLKTLACVYHIHKYAVKQTAPTPPELILKISFMPFEVEAKHLLHEYAKTYWNILVDRLSYIERLRTKISIIKVLPKLTEDIMKIVEIYDTVQFCSNVILYIIKKLYCLYEKHSKELNQIYEQIFTKLSTKDTKNFKKLNNKELIEIYVKFNECFYIIAENSSRICFKDSPLNNIVRTCISIVGHSPDLFHCLQTFYSNTFCSILTETTHLTYTETVLNCLLVSIETTEKLSYGRAMLATYPFLNQFLRLFIEYNVTNSTKNPWKDNFNIQIQEICLKLIHIIIKRLKNCDQLLKCDSCQIKTGLHDSLRLSFLVKHFIIVSISQNLLIKDLLPLIYEIINEQYKILTELKELGCVNYEKCFRKLQTDVHNTAISLNKAQYYEFSIKLFDIYLNYEINSALTEQKNLSRALYNKSICELDSKFYENALIDAFLSLIFGEEPSSDKYMSLVIDIKAKELKSKSDDEIKTETVQLISVLNACEIAIEKEIYGNIKPYLENSKFSDLLKHEFLMYAKLWPSVTPIAGVWRSLLALTEGKWIFSEDPKATWSLYEVIIQTPSVVRTITGDHFKEIITQLLKGLDQTSLSPDLKIVKSSLLFWTAEMDLAAASEKYGWKNEPVQSMDPDQIPANRTIPQEFNATKAAVHAVSILAELSEDFKIVTNTDCLHNSLRIYEVYVQLLLHFGRDVEGLQLAYICYLIADCVSDKEAYVRNASTLLYHGGTNPALRDVVLTVAPAVTPNPRSYGPAVTFLCDASIYYSRCGEVGFAARLVQLAQAQILKCMESDPDINLDMPVGGLLDAQAQLCAESGASALSAANRLHRHYLCVASKGAKWHARRLHAAELRVRSALAGARAVCAARALRETGRARAAAAPALHAAAAAARAQLYTLITDACSYDDAQIKIDNRLKHMLGLQPSNETQPYFATAETKLPPFTPKQELETMLENLVFKKSQTSPSICMSVPAFKTPDFFHHSSQCECYACTMPACYILACHTSGLEASMYFRAKETDISRNYFNGVIKMLNSTENKLASIKKRFKKSYKGFIVDIVMEKYWEWFRKVKIEVLIELAFFELNCGAYDVADEHIVEIHEVMQETKLCKYMSNDVLNLMTCSAQLRNIIKTPTDNSLTAEFDSLKLSPLKFIEPPKTPVTKLSKPPQNTVKIARDEEIPKKRKVIKLKLEDEDNEIIVSKKTEFKIPEPVIKHVLETATPITKSKPSILITLPESTPKSNTTVYSTPKDTPEQFFTPLTSVKTYAKRSLRQNIVKNLEQEFSTPKSLQKENLKRTEQLQIPSRSKLNVKTTLKRATSPGKLSKETSSSRLCKETPRARRLRKPVNFSVDEDERR